MKPDYRNVLDAANNKRPARLPLYDHFVNDPIIEKILGEPVNQEMRDGTESDTNEYFGRYCRFYRDMTYDTVSFESCVTDFIPEGGALLKVEAVGMCSSDVMQLAGHKHVPGEVTPIVAGHEIVGRVEELADGADLGVEVGDRVAVDMINRRFAYRGSRLVVYGYTLGLDDESGLWGGYGEYMCVLPGTHLLKLTESLPAEHMTLCEPLANALNFTSLAGVAEGDTVVVLGPGPMGLMCVIAAKAAGAFRAFGAFHSVPQQVQNLLADLLELQAEVHQDLGGHALLLAQQAQQDMFGTHVVVVEVSGFFHRVLDDLLRPGRLGQFAHGDHVGAALHELLDFQPDLAQIDVQVLQHVGRHPAALFDQAQQDMLGPDVFVIEPLRLLIGQLHDLPGTVRKSLVHDDSPSDGCVFLSECCLGGFASH